jgi:hypothetical protein
VQAPTKYDLTINLKTAKALGLDVPPPVLERVRRVGFVINAAPEDTKAQSYVAAFQQGMQDHGWSIGRNLSIDLRWAGNDNDRSRQYAAKLVGLLLPRAMAASEATDPGGPLKLSL